MSGLHYYNENNPYRAAVLRERMAEGLLPKGVVDERDIQVVPDEDFLGYTQVHLFAGIGGFPLGLRQAGFSEQRRIVTGGFPCQDISNAGKRAGITGTRSRLWREMVRCIRVVGQGTADAEWCREVVADATERRQPVRGESSGRDGLATRSGETFSDADAFGRDGRTNDEGEAPPERNRIAQSDLADADGGRCEQRHARERRLPVVDAGSVSHPTETRLEGPDFGEVGGIAGRPDRWPVEPNVGRVANGIPKRVDRLAALGDAIVPQCVAEVVKRLGL